MINKENNNNQNNNDKKDDSGFVDTAQMDVQCHLLIKDKDTGSVILNKRG